MCLLFFKNTLSHFCQTIFVKTSSPITLVEDEPVVCFDYITDTTEDAVTGIIAIENTGHEISAAPETNNNYLSYQKGKYYVIAGSFLKEEDANRHIKNEKLEKYQAKLIIHPDNPRIRVCIKIFDNEKDAVLFAEQFKKNYWVLK